MFLLGDDQVHLACAAQVAPSTICQILSIFPMMSWEAFPRTPACSRPTPSTRLVVDKSGKVIYQGEASSALAVSTAMLASDE